MSQPGQVTQLIDYKITTMKDWYTLEDLADKAIGHMREIGQLECGLQDAKNYFQKLVAIKKYYEAIEPKIKETFRMSITRWAVCYPMNWLEIFTPIEFMAWQSMRCKGRIVMYPQYPVLNFHADFANPGLKIVLELDGADYHDERRDKDRNKRMNEAGWTVYRITGKEMVNLNYKDFASFRDEDIEDINEQAAHLKDWLTNSGDGVIEAIRKVHFHDPFYYDSDIEERYVSYCHQSLELHRA